MASQVDPRVLLAQAQALEAQINRLQSLLAELTANRDNVYRSKESMRALAKAEEPVVIPLDPGMVSLAQVEAKDRSRFIVHLGLDIYAKLPLDEAVKVLEEKEERLARSIGEVTKQLKELTAMYEQYQVLLQQLATAQQAARR